MQVISSVSVTPKHQKSSAKSFLALLDPTAQRFTFQFFSDGDDGHAEIFHGSLDEVWPKVEAVNTLERRSGVFVTINETDFGGRRVENIVRPRALFVDADGKDQIQRCRDVIRATGATPTMVVGTSAGRAHFYWCCDDLPRDQFSALQAALIEKLGTDRAVKDLTRVMRLPGTLHLKDANATTNVTLLVADPARRWKFDDLSARLVLDVSLLRNREKPQSNEPPFTCVDAERLKRLFGAQYFAANELRAGLLTNIEEIKSVVVAIPPSAISSEPDWVKVARGMAHEARIYTAQAEDLYQILDAASAPAPGYDPAENRRRWERYIDEALDRVNPITIATVFDTARKHGWSGWTAPTSPSYSAPKFETIDPAKVPRHRPWVYATKLIKGENTVLAGKGGWGKSAYAVVVTCAAAAGRDLLDEKVWGGPKRVLYMNSEDDVDELQRRFLAAYHHHRLTNAEIANILIRGVDSPGHQTLTTGDDNAAQLNEAGFALLDQLVGEAKAEIAVLDPLGPFCPAGLNSNGVMGQVLLKLKRIARKHQCAILIIHHTRKDGDLTNTDAIGGASAIVNQARVALLVARMTTDEARKFPGVLESETWQYIRITDAKTNLAPPSSHTNWLRLVSYDLPNAEPPIYPKGDGVQVVDRVALAQLSVSPTSNATNDAAKRAILKAAYHANPPFSPSARGGSDRYIVPKVLAAVRQATGLSWDDRDLKKHVEGLIKEMTADGLLRVSDVKVGRNPRQGIIVEPTRTPWPDDLAHPTERPCAAAQPQMHQIPFETIDAHRTGDIDAPRPEGASNVPIGSGDLIKKVFDSAAGDHPMVDAGEAEVPAAISPHAAPRRPGDDLDIPSFLRRESQQTTSERRTDSATPEPAIGTAPLHQRPANSSIIGGTRVSTAASIDINKGPKR